MRKEINKKNEEDCFLLAGGIDFRYNGREQGGDGGRGERKCKGKREKGEEGKRKEGEGVASARVGGEGEGREKGKMRKCKN